MGIMFLFVIMFAPKGIVGSIGKYWRSLGLPIASWFGLGRGATMEGSQAGETLPNASRSGKEGGDKKLRKGGSQGGKLSLEDRFRESL